MQLSLLHVEKHVLTSRDSLKAVVVLLPLLGITWIIGILAVDENTQAFAWIFAILNSLQVNQMACLYISLKYIYTQSDTKVYTYITTCVVASKLLSS